MTDDRFHIDVYDRTLKWLFPVDDYVRCTARPNILEAGNAEIVLRSSHMRSAAMHEHGVRVIVRDRDGRHLVGGPIQKLSGSGPSRGSEVAFTVMDDAWLLSRTLAWPKPLQANGAPATPAMQGDEGTHYILTGVPAETAIKRTAGDNFKRLNLGVTVATDQGRGGKVNVKARMSNVWDAACAAAIPAGVYATIRQTGATPQATQAIVLDVTPIATVGPVLSTLSGEISDWHYDYVGPDVQFGAAGGQGEGTARQFVAWENTDELVAWGRSFGGEMFDDQRAESLAASLLAGLQQSMREKASQPTVTLTLTETPTWGYGTAWHVGDKVRADVIPGVGVAEYPITSAELVHDVETGWKATSTAGTTGRTLQARIIKSLAARLRNQEAR